jgi:glycosyltransferase involved in cell wall biosynthesis
MLGRQIARVAREHGAGVLHCHHYSPYVYGQMARVWKPDLRVVFTEHGRLSDAPPSGKRRIANQVLGRLPAAVFAVSRDLRLHMIAEGFPERRVGVLYNGIELGREVAAGQRAAARQALGLAPDSVAIGAVGRLDPVKDLPTLLRAFQQLKSAPNDLRLILLGDGPERESLEALAGSLELEGRVHFLGYRRDVRALLPALDLFVNCSIHEGVSLTILEAMAASLPVVATRVGGTPEVVVDEQTGVLVPPRSATALADALRALLQAPDRARRLGTLGRSRVVAEFNIDRMVESYRRVYEGAPVE